MNRLSKLFLRTIMYNNIHSLIYYFFSWIWEYFSKSLLEHNKRTRFILGYRVLWKGTITYILVSLHPPAPPCRQRATISGIRTWSLIKIDYQTRQQVVSSPSNYRRRRRTTSPSKTAVNRHFVVLPGVSNEKPNSKSIYLLTLHLHFTSKSIYLLTLSRAEGSKKHRDIVF